MLSAACRIRSFRIRDQPQSGLADARDWSRTSTSIIGHKHLKLARLPIPPPGLQYQPEECTETVYTVNAYGWEAILIALAVK